MNTGRDILIVLAVVIGLGFAAIAINSKAPSLQSLTPNLIRQPLTQPDYTNIRATNPDTSANVNQEQTAREIERQIAEAEAEITLIEKQIEEIETYGEVSRYKGMVLLSPYSSNPRSKDVNYELIQLQVSNTNTEALDMTNWRLKSSVTGRSAGFGGVVPLFFSGDVNPELPFVVSAGDKASIITGRSPIGESFQINLCSGYFTQFQQFYPNIPLTCPAPNEEIRSYTRDESIFVDDACIDYVDRLPRCRVQTTQLPLNLSFTCQDAIFTEINYNSCVSKHKDEESFYSGDWRVYLKRSEELWKEKREIILLLDEYGKTVDYMSY